MKIVVSGATGFLGGHLCRRLVELGHDVVGLGRDAAKGTSLGIPFEAVDLGVTSRLTGIESADAFVHCAAMSSNWGRRSDFELANVTGTHNALAMAQKLGVRRFVHISSPSVTFRYSDQLAVREDAPLPHPVNAYAATKQRAEAIIHGRTGVPSIVLRPRGLYGPGDTALLPRLLRAVRSGPLPLIRHGDTVIDLTYIDDAVNAIVLALGAPTSCDGRTYHVSGGEALRIRDIAVLSAAAAGVPIRFTGIPAALALAAAHLAELVANLTPGRPEPLFTAYSVGLMAYSQTLDIDAARRDLGYSPQVSFAEGLRRTFPGGSVA